ncbi:MAG TPA: isochorismatase family protein [Erysipelothrix sp.]|nr:isochorismatase family protein [Erysipelothrix sp.]
MKQLVVIDCQNDFITGSLACENAQEAVDYIVELLKAHPETDVFYTLDWHSPNHMSFKKNGGIWPDHCVQHSPGARLSEAFQQLPPAQQPHIGNMFYKGANDNLEEYSGVQAKNQEGIVLKDYLKSGAYIAGIASEYCVKETVFELLDTVELKVLEPGLGYVSLDTHQQALAAYQEKDLLVHHVDSLV